MSFAFDETDPDIQDALDRTINETSKKRVLVFAAASNNSSLKKEPIGFPARMTERVISVFSSTVNEFRSEFSPKGLNHQPNFSVPGENVEAAWPFSLDSSNGSQNMSGTSCATPIVAGIAALLLDFAKKNGPDVRELNDWNKLKQQLWRTDGMRSVLKKCMSDEGRMDGEYNFLKPWKLLLKQDFVAIAHAITGALESSHR
jgi:hypothetical protein